MDAGPPRRVDPITTASLERRGKDPGFVSNGSILRHRSALFVALLAGCSPGVDTLPSSDAGSTGDAGVDAGTPDPSWSDDDVFNEDEVATYELTVTPAEWDYLNEHVLDEEYVPATLTYRGQTWANIGVRYKGGFGTLKLCVDEAGNRVCPKLSMKLKFNEYVPEQLFFGLKRLNFHAMHYDESHMKDRLAYSLFRASGVPAPRAAHARLVVNGELLGVFALVEEIDGRFTEDRFNTKDGGDGNLYKSIWPASLDPQPYIAALETNETTPDVDRMVRFAKALAAADDTTFRVTLEQWMDLPTLIRYLAVDRFIDNWDGIVGWYCPDGPDACHNHNYFWYEQSDADRVWLLPWDMDNTFQSPNPIRENYGMPDWNEDGGACGIIPVFYGIPGRAPSCDPFIDRMATILWDDYRAATAELLAGDAAPGLLEAKIDAMEKQLAPLVAEDPNGPGAFAWQSAVADLRADLPAFRARVAP
jgi:spore coat protein H